jgi:predicted HicB family RNase H-like nuclease
MHRCRRDVPAPSFHPEPVETMSGKFVARVPKSIHASLAARALPQPIPAY